MGVYPIARARGEQVRWLIVNPFVDDVLSGRQHFGEFPQVEAEILIGVYAAGWLMRVSRQKTDEKPDIEQIVGQDEVWAICPRKPAPGWRILGRFYQKDIFIGLDAVDKHKLARNYEKFSAETIKRWGEIFPQCDPLRGQNISDYLSGVTKDVDEKI